MGKEIKIGNIKMMPYNVDIARTIQCGCDAIRNQYKEDCYFYIEVKDMAANIPTCDYYTQLGYCPCNECKKYVKRSEVYKIVRKFADEK